MRLFKGDAYIEVDTDTETLKFDQRDAIYGRRLSLSFDCLLTDSKHPNKGVIRIRNLKESNRMKIVSLGKKVRLYAGYGIEKLISVGDLSFADSRKDGPDWVVEMRYGDGQTAYDNATTSVSVSDGTEVQTVVDMLARDMGIVLRASKDALSGVINGGLTLDGLTKDELETFTKDHGLTWSIQDDELRVVKRGKPIDNEVIVLSAATGLLEVQRLIKPPKKDGESKKEEEKAGDIKFRAQLHPDLRPGKLVQIESISYTIDNSDPKAAKKSNPSYNGLYICRNVLFTGVNDEGVFEVTCEADEYVQ
ncbi:MAG: hypothetical protein ACRCYD_09505 [Plesiomonas sp.]